MGIASIFRRRQRLLLIAGILSVLIYLWLALPFSRGSKPVYDLQYYKSNYPKAYKYIYEAGQAPGVREAGGVWYIPPAWLNASEPAPTTILQAAELAQQKAQEQNHTIPFSTIPLLVHQTWKDTHLYLWPLDIALGVEKWLSYAQTNGPGYGSMAYFLWLDDGCDSLFSSRRPQLQEDIKALPLPVMRSDVFRVVVVNEIGGIYGDIDTHPLRDPASWLDASDIQPWTDPIAAKTHSIFSEQQVSGVAPADFARPAKLLLGLEADTKPGTDNHWRMGYTHPVQLTQWALAGAAHHPVLDKFVENFEDRLEEIAEPYNRSISAAARAGALKKEDPLALTGPEAITMAAKQSLSESCGLRWDAVSGRPDANEYGREGRSKTVGSTIILPITAFSPGRGKYGNMGSKSVGHESARLQHKAQGSWRKVDVGIEIGKACRTFLGRCKDWSKVPS